MKKSVKYNNGLISIEIVENPDAIVLPEAEHSITLIVNKMVDSKLDNGHVIWKRKSVKIEEGDESEDIKRLVASALTIGKKYIDTNFREGGSPIKQALAAEGFEERE